MNDDELRTRIDLVKRQVRLEDEVRRRGVELRVGRSHSSRMEGCCPFHNDRHPSLSLYTETQRYYCFGCGATGDVLDFVQAWEGCSLIEALDRLTLNASLPTGQVVPEPGTANRRESQWTAACELNKRQDNRSILTQAQDIYQHVLRETPHALHYLQARGITKQTREQLKLGYADGKTLRQILQGHEKPWRAAIQAGLFSQSRREWLAGRIILPDLDASGHVLWMIGRLVPTAGQPSPQTRKLAEKYRGLPLSKGLFGYHQALAFWHAQQRSLQALLLVEGAFDYILAWQWELPVLPVALLGTHPSRRQWAELLHLQQVTGLPIIDWHDADEPGRQAALQVHERAAGPLLLFPEIAGVKDLADLSQLPDGLLRLRHAWHAISDSREE